jgi:tetratricopeptide (TPR) repeat protein
MDAGVAGVVAMRYNVYVVTAAQLVAELYASLGRGSALGEAVTLARKNLHDNPLREVAFDPIPLQDWSVPVVFEAAPVQLFPKAKERSGLQIRIAAGDTSSASGSLDSSLPPPPDAGFFGRDETLLALDRAFDQDSIVLLHAYAGSGKTATSAEFARWYSLTGGVEGPVLFTSFEHYLPLSRVLDRIGQVFGTMLEKAGIHWLALEDAQRRDIALQVLSQIPVLWIWDNVEPVAGFPAGTESAWSGEEQAELVAFLRAARKTKAKFLLTSRRDERAWLGDLPTRIAVPAMPMTERLQLARALATKHGRRLSEVEDWRPLLAFTRGNPLTLTVLVGQALRQGFYTREQIESFVAQLRSGEASFSDEASEGRSRSLGASLSYGFEHAFSEEERKTLALLHFFQGFVGANALYLMGSPEAPWCLSELRNLTREEGIALLDRAAEVGLLTSHGSGYYSIHPALPWFFQGIFDQKYSKGNLRATQAFVNAMGALGSYYFYQHEEGLGASVDVLQGEEANLLHAYRLALTNGWWESVVSTLQGVSSLYRHAGRYVEWKRLVKEVLPYFVDLEDDQPLPDREEGWRIVTQYRVEISRRELRRPEAERLQALIIRWLRQNTISDFDSNSQAGELDTEKRNLLRSLAVSLETLGHIRRELDQEECILSYKEALDISEEINDKTLGASCSFNLGHAFLVVAKVRDLNLAEYWYKKSLALRGVNDKIRRGRCFVQLGSIALARFRGAIEGGQEELLARYLAEAAQHLLEGLDLISSDAVNDLAVVHNQLGLVYGYAGDQGNAFLHYRQAIHFQERAGNFLQASMTRFNVAVNLLDAGRRADALVYGEAALRGFESYGDRAAEEIESTRRLIGEIRGE